MNRPQLINGGGCPMLTAKQRRFAAEYLQDMNATAAYRRAGYKARGHAAEVNACRLLRNAEVQRLVRDHQAATEEQLASTRIQVLNELGRIGFGPERVAERTRALGLLARHFSREGEPADAAVKTSDEQVCLLTQHDPYDLTNLTDEDIATLEAIVEKLSLPLMARCPCTRCRAARTPHTSSGTHCDCGKCVTASKLHALESSNARYRP
jgi:hypothetical protein